MKYGYVNYYDLYKPTSFFDTGYVNCAVGTGGSAQTTTIKTLPKNRYNMLPFCVVLRLDGTIASGETITADLIVVYDDGTEETLLSATTTGSATTKVAGSEALENLSSVDGKRIVEFKTSASSSASTTSATVTARVVGVYG